MAFGGRGKRRGGGSGFNFIRSAKQEPFQLFPEINDEDLGKATNVNERVSLAVWYSKLQKYWNSSPYYIGDENDDSKKAMSADIERYSDRNSDRAKVKPSLLHFITVDPAFFPVELTKGGRGRRHPKERVSWNQDSDSFLDKLEQKESRGQDMDEKKENVGEGEDEEEGEDNIEEEEEADFSDDDYNQNIDFDDDEDDFNMADDNDDEGGTY